MCGIDIVDFRRHGKEETRLGRHELKRETDSSSKLHDALMLGSHLDAICYFSLCISLYLYLDTILLSR